MDDNWEERVWGWATVILLVVFGLLVLFQSLR